tara:strand:- start:213 stop:1106 length:894 start_codon:yes stop_codon:yes gene_type:complete
LKKILIAGGSGLLGVNSSKYLSNKYKIYSLYSSTKYFFENKNIETIQSDLTNFQLTNDIISFINPDIILNFSGLTSVEKCQKFPALASELNIKVANHLSIISQKLNMYYVQMSTDHLFNQLNIFFEESNTTDPINIYSKTKVEAERISLFNNPKSLIIRSNFYCSSIDSKISFIDKIIEDTKNNNQLKLFNDVTFTPVSFNLMLDYIVDLYNLNAYGIFNISSNEKISKYEFGLKVLNYHRMDVTNVKKISINDLKLVKRPLNMALSNNKLKNFLKIQTPSIDDQLNLFFNNFAYKN